MTAVPRRLGWAVLAGIGALAFTLTALGLSWQVGTSIGDGRFGSITGTAGLGALTLLFWWWITLGSWNRFRPPLDPSTGQPLREEEPVGPWGVVGRVLVVVLVGTFVAGGILLAVGARRATQAAERVRERAEREANARNLTVADVEQAQRDELIWMRGGEGPSPYGELLSVPGATVADVSVDGHRAAILLRLRESPPCVVVEIDADDLVATRITSSCD